MKKENPIPELLSPAGSEEALHAAVDSGADAVYLGGPQMQLRAGQVGFSMENLAQAIREAHSVNRRVYVTVNAFACNRDIDALPDYAQALESLGTDAVIVSDLGAIAAIRKAAPHLPVHVSTQANCLNYASARVYADSFAGVSSFVKSLLHLRLFMFAAPPGAAAKSPKIAQKHFTFRRIFATINTIHERNT